MVDVYVYTDRYDKAVATAEESWEALKQGYGPDHPESVLMRRAALELLAVHAPK
jgi:hypothetical protein